MTLRTFLFRKVILFPNFKIANQTPRNIITQEQLHSGAGLCQMGQSPNRRLANRRLRYHPSFPCSSRCFSMGREQRREISIIELGLPVAALRAMAQLYGTAHNQTCENALNCNESEHLEALWCKQPPPSIPDPEPYKYAPQRAPSFQCSSALNILILLNSLIIKSQ